MLVAQELKVVRKTRFERNIVALRRLKEQSNVLRKPIFMQHKKNQNMQSGFLLNFYSKSCCSSIANETLNPQQVAPLERPTDKAMSGQTQATRHKWSASITSHVAQVDMHRELILL